MRLWLIPLLLPPLLAAQTKVLVIGDSLSSEYQYQVPFSAPDSDQLNANTKNWIEILLDRREADFDFGDKSDLYVDLRGPGYEYNWGVPGGETDLWSEVCDSGPLDNLVFWLSKETILDQVNEVDVAVIMLGGNDVNKIYGELYDNTPPADYPGGIIDRYTELLEKLRDERSDLPLIIVNTPDIGASPDIQEDHPDPALRAVASLHIADLNSALATVAQSFNAQLVDFAELTASLLDPDPFYIGSQLMVKSYGPENPPDHLFCKLKFHPSSGLHALLANRIVHAINTKLGTTITTLPPREIIAEVLGLNPDQAFLDWIATYPGASTGFFTDDDFDKLDTLAEFALGTDPLVADHPNFLQHKAASSIMSYAPDPSAARFVNIIPEESTDLLNWTPIPAAQLVELPNGTIQANLLPGPNRFSRLRFSLQP